MLKKLIDERCIKISAMADKLELSTTTIYAHYAGTAMSLTTARKYAKFFGITLDEFLGE